ncbi:Uncharacterised protein [Vibrio cholerae]|nr:Uncharacterised protein [Vibrio cholerae]CSC72843.1 Uncharacterised protein [Vibrio cholerae]
MNKINPYFEVNFKNAITRKFGFKESLWPVVASL